MPVVKGAASDVTANVKAGAEVNGAIGGAVAKGGNSAPPRAGGSAAASAAVTQSKAAKTSSTPVATVFRIPPIVVPVAWTPALLSSVRMWLDGNDPFGNGSVPSNGTVITTWKDKTANGRDATARGSPVIITSSETNKRGIYLRDTGGNQVGAYLGGTKHSYSIPFGTGFFNTGLGMVYVYKGIQSTPNGYYGPMNRWDGSVFDQYGGARGGHWGGGGSPWNHAGGAPTGPMQNTSIVTQFIKKKESDQTKWTFEEHANGTAINVDAGLVTLARPFTDSGATIFYIGDRNDNITGFEGHMYEVIIFNTAITTAERQSLEGYLAWKWGLVSKLPVGHPYKAFSPML